jgi:hypothetical protein
LGTQSLAAQGLDDIAERFLLSIRRTRCEGERALWIESTLGVGM